MKLRYLLPALLLGALPLTAAHAFVGISINIAPPALPIYEQPPCPVEGYLWTPGYYAYGDDGYYWVPGVWCAPPRVGFLWTPGYWGYGDGFYAFHSGYWGPTVGFYGGVHYGYGYEGYGYCGGRWDGPHFRYNTAVTRVNTTIIHNTYIDRTVVERGPHQRASFNGPGGVQARPDARQLAAARGPRLKPTPAQLAQRGADRRGGFAGNARPVNRDRQAIAARPGRRDGLSPEERRVVSRRQAAMDQRRAPGGYGYDRSAPRRGAYDERANRSVSNERRYSDPRLRAERNARPPQRADRRVETGERKRDDRKRDKRDERG